MVMQVPCPEQSPGHRAFDVEPRIVFSVIGHAWVREITLEETRVIMSCLRWASLKDGAP